MWEVRGEGARLGGGGVVGGWGVSGRQCIPGTDEIQDIT